MPQAEKHASTARKRIGPVRKHGKRKSNLLRGGALTRYERRLLGFSHRQVGGRSARRSC